MNYIKNSSRSACLLSISALAALLIAGCKSESHHHSDMKMSESSSTSMASAKPATPAAPAITVTPAAPAKPAAPAAPAEPAKPAAATAPTAAAVRVNAGATAPYTDSEGNVWAPDQGFEEGDTIERAADLPIANTKDAAIYRTEHYGMKSFSAKVPNGKYKVKLHFAETFEGIGGPGERVFSFNVEGHDFKDFDVFKKAGGAQKAYIETVDTDITDGKLDITFTSNVENPEINGIEIIPAP